MKRKLTELGKDVLIVLLLAAMLFLILLALPESTVRASAPLRWTAQKLGLLEPGAELPEQNGSADSAAQPIAVSVRSASGRASFCGDFAVMDALYDQLGSMLGKALGTAEGGEAVTEEALRGAASGQSLYFAFRGSIPVDALARWLGAESCLPDGCAGQFLLTAEGDRVRLLVCGETCTAYDTQLSAELLRSELNTFRPDGSAFAFEMPGYPFAPMTLLPGSVRTLSGAAAENPYSRELLLAVAAALECNPYGAGAYTDPSGSAVFTEAGRSCTVSPGGHVEITATDDSYAAFRAADETPAARTQTAGAVLQSICGGQIGDARLFLESYTEDGETAVCRFRYVLDGVPVFTLEAGVTFRGARLLTLSVTLRAYRLTSETLTLLPIPQAAAIAEAGSTLSAGYVDSGTGSLSAGWTTQ